MAAEAVVTFAAEEVLKKVFSLAQKELRLAWGFEAELRKLQESSANIRLLLNNVADKPQDPSIEGWVKKLKGVADDAEDVLDEFQYEVDRRKVEIQNHMKKKVLNFFSLSNPLAFRLKMAHKFQKINASLVDLKTEASITLSLIPVHRDATPHGIRWDRRTDSLIGKDEITVGREDDVSNIVKILTDSKTNNQEDLAVMAIVGMGGLGKTTLAKSISNQGSIHNFFEKRIWVCVSDTFDVTLILCRMLESLTLTKAPSEDNQDAILKKLQEDLKGKRYLLILDDVWNEDVGKWECLMECLSKFNSGGGSKIIVTTRNGKVASISEKLLPRHELEKLSVDQCWSIMKNKALPNSSDPKFEAIGKEIAKNCGGVPLAAKVLGSILQTKKRIEEWSSFKNNGIWNNLSKGEDRIMPVLKLSFDNLESASLKQCFAYCSMFKKDFEIERDNLIQLWMAQGLLHPSHGESKEMEDIGNEYFDILLQSSLFQDATMSDNSIVSKCTMHDLVHDLAELVSKSEILTGDSCGIDNTLEIRHVARVSTSTLEKIPERSAGKLRSLFFNDGEVPTNILPRFKCLRVLNLNGANIKEYPVSVGVLKHLRYLDISDTRFEALPKSIGKLYNLQTLRAVDCPLEEFPKKLKNLINLRHIYFDKDIKFPKGIGQLTSLRTLPYFSVGNEIGRRIEELAGLKQLKGELVVRNLEHVKNGEEAKKAKLEDKTKVTHLSLEWTRDRSTTDNNEKEDVLEGLRPHSGLESLRIKNFMGNKFPSWMMSAPLLLNNLKKIQLLGCHRCGGVSPLGHLLEELTIEECPCLELIPITQGMTSLCKLKIRDCGKLSLPPSGLEYCTSLRELVISNCNGLSGPLSVWASLVELDIQDCNNLTSIEMKGSGSLTASLQKLIIGSCNELSWFGVKSSRVEKEEEEECPKLASFCAQSSRIDEEECISLQSTSDLRTITSLRELTISQCERLESWVSSLQFPLSLETLTIRGIPNLEILPSLDNLSSLTYLEIGGFWEELDSFPDFEVGSLMNLEYLELYGWPKLKSLPQQIQHLTSLTDLEIYEIDGVETLPEWLGSLTSLTWLEIQGCKNLMNLPSVQAMQRLTKLRSLWISGCHPLLKERCRRDSGTDWPKISHIPHFEISVEV